MNETMLRSDWRTSARDAVSARVAPIPPPLLLRTLHRVMAAAESNAIALLSTSPGQSAREAAERIAAETEAAGCRTAILDDHALEAWPRAGESRPARDAHAAFDLVLVVSSPPAPMMPCAGALLLVEAGVSRAPDIEAAAAGCVGAGLPLLGLVWWGRARR